MLVEYKSICRLTMIGLCLLALFPAFALSKSVASADITEIQVCQYFDARIVRFEEKVKEMKELVDVDSEFYRTLEASKLCDTVGRVAVPECVANHEGDECAAAKIESIKKPLLRAIKVDKSGKEFFDYCKYIGYKNVLNTFLKTRKLMSGECGLPGQKSSSDREGRNSLLLPLLVAGAYDPSSIWFQYFLCKDQQIYCYFFNQGWNQYEYGQYYLYENLLDDTTGIFAGATDSNLATLALLGGLGGGTPGYYPSPSGYSQVPAGQGRKRRGSGEDSCVDGVGDGCPSERKRRSEVKCVEGDMSCDRKRRQAPDECVDGKCDDRKRRQTSDNCEDGKCDERKRRQTPGQTSEDCKDGKCNDRNRRQTLGQTTDDCKDGKCNDRKRRQTLGQTIDECKDGNCNDRKRRQTSDDCKDGNCSNERKRRQTPGQTSDECKDGNCNDRKRRQTPGQTSDDCKDGKCSDRKRRQTHGQTSDDCKDGNCSDRKPSDIWSDI